MINIIKVGQIYELPETKGRVVVIRAPETKSGYLRISRKDPQVVLSALRRRRNHSGGRNSRGWNRANNSNRPA